MNRRGLLLNGAAFAVAGAFAAHAQGSGIDRDVVAWLKAHALPLAGVAPGTPFNDLAQLRTRIGDARIVSLGEATHGTREFFQLKHRMIEYCVSQLGFTLIGFEADYGMTLPVNDYVLHGRGNAADAVAGMGFWSWNTEEIVALVEWLRSWNLSHERKVKFYGVDMQGGPASALHLLGYLERVAAELALSAEQDLLPLLSAYTSEFHLLPKAAQERTSARIKIVLDAFAAQRARWIEQAGELEWRHARQCAIVLDHSVREALGTISRDRAMAEHVRLLLDAESPNAKVLLWAHNVHVQRSGFLGRPNMGSRLREAFGTQHLAVGFAFNQGSFRALNLENMIVDHVVGPAPDTFLDAALAATGIPLFALDLARVPATGPVAAWMAGQPLQRTYGAVFAPEYELRHAYAGDPRANFDLLLFVESTAAARGNTGTVIDLPPAQFLIAETNAEPTNLALAGDGQIPAGWHATSNSINPYDVTRADQASPRGGRTVRITRAPAPRQLGEGALTQVFPAAPWSGRRLVFSAALRAEATHIGTGAQLVVQVWPKLKAGSADEWEGAPILALQPEGIVRSPDWVRRSVAVDIPAHAERIQISLLVSGNTSGWFGDLALDAATR